MLNKLNSWILKIYGCGHCDKYLIHRKIPDFQWEALEGTKDYTNFEIIQLP